MPLPWQISLQIKHPLSQERRGGGADKFSGDIKKKKKKVLMAVKIAKLNHHNCK